MLIGLNTNKKTKLKPDGGTFTFYLYEKWQLNNKSALALSNLITIGQPTQLPISSTSIAMYGKNRHLLQWPSGTEGS